MISAFQVLLVACSFVITTIGLPRRNVTITVPDGFSNHIVLFFAVNYGAHAATIGSRPGQTYYHTARDIAFALVFPFSGVMRAIESFARCSWPSENDFVKAARAGALCVVVRNHEWQSTGESQIVEAPLKQTSAGAISIENLQSGGSLRMQSGEKKDEGSADQIEAYQDTHKGPSVQDTDPSPPKLLEDIGSTPLETASGGPDALFDITLLAAEAHRSYRNIHGMCKLPRGYSLTSLPSNAKIISDVSDKPEDIELCSSYNVPKAIVAIVQTIYASITLYNARGDQIQRYGYAAYGLTVLPYLIMSIMNLFAALLLPNYPSLYIVRSLELDEAITDGGQVDAAVGRIIQRTIENQKSLQGKRKLSSDTTTVRPADQYVPGRSAMESVSNESQEEDECFDMPALRITHAHSRTAGFCDRPRLVEEVGAKRWGLGRKLLGNLLVSYVLGAIPIVVIGIWTRFDPGKSTTAQRAWIMTWLVANISYGPIANILSEKNNIAMMVGEGWVKLGHSKRWETRMAGNRIIVPLLSFIYNPILDLEEHQILLSIVLCTTPTIGGFVVVGQMLQAYGSCIGIT